jgi:hypothetical protein
MDKEPNIASWMIPKKDTDINNNTIRSTNTYVQKKVTTAKAKKQGSRMAKISNKAKKTFAAVLITIAGYGAADALYKNTTEQVVHAGDSAPTVEGVHENANRTGELTGDTFASDTIYANPGITTEQLKETLADKNKANNYMNNNGATPHVTSVGARAINNIANNITGVSNADRLTGAIEDVAKNYDISQNADGSFNLSEKAKTK